MLRLKKESIEEIKRQAREGYPLECGGFLAGGNASGKEITAVYPMKNLNSDQPRIRFEIDPKEFQRIEAEATKNSLQLLVFYHTHPDSPLKTNPSAFDRERAEGLSTFWPDLSYLIVSVDKGKEFQLASWVFNPAKMAFEDEIVIPELRKDYNDAQFLVIDFEKFRLYDLTSVGISQTILNEANRPENKIFQQLLAEEALSVTKFKEAVKKLTKYLVKLAKPRKEQKTYGVFVIPAQTNVLKKQCIMEAASEIFDGAMVVSKPFSI